ncbi:hypothetical protein KATP_32810 [Kluyvera ascorbata]|nr:hypothetical protein KATP_32810 [Kluyvera ascorbata]
MCSPVQVVPVTIKTAARPAESQSAYDDVTPLSQRRDYTGSITFFSADDMMNHSQRYARNDE